MDTAAEVLERFCWANGTSNVGYKHHLLGGSGCRNSPTTEIGLCGECYLEIVGVGAANSDTAASSLASR